MSVCVDFAGFLMNPKIHPFSLAACVCCTAGWCSVISACRVQNNRKTKAFISLAAVQGRCYCYDFS